METNPELREDKEKRAQKVIDTTFRARSPRREETD